jgi:MFS family permease
MSAWGNAGEYTMLSELGGPDGRLAMNSLAGAQVSFSVIVGPALAGLLIAGIGPGWLIALDAASFAFLGIQARRTPTGAVTTGEPLDTRAAESGFRLLRRRDLLSLTVLTWLFFFLYGPVEAPSPSTSHATSRRTPRCSAPTGRPSVWARSPPPSSPARFATTTSDGSPS